jgi:transposase-like protein
VVQLNSERYWLYATVDLDFNRLLHVRLYPTRTNVISSIFLSELREKHQVDKAVFLLDGAPWLQTVCHRHELRFQHVTQENPNIVENINYKVQQRKNQLLNTFNHDESNR